MIHIFLFKSASGQMFSVNHISIITISLFGWEISLWISPLKESKGCKVSKNKSKNINFSLYGCFLCMSIRDCQPQEWWIQKSFMFHQFLFSTQKPWQALNQELKCKFIFLLGKAATFSSRSQKLWKCQVHNVSSELEFCQLTETFNCCYQNLLSKVDLKNDKSKNK